MPKDLTKLSLKEFEAISTGEFDSGTRWSNGTLEMVVTQAPHGMDLDDGDYEE